MNLLRDLIRERGKAAVLTAACENPVEMRERVFSLAKLDREIVSLVDLIVRALDKEADAGRM